MTGIVAVQMIGALAAFAVMALAPPSIGEMRLVGAGGAGRQVAIALDAGARIVRLSADGSLVIHGERASLLYPLLRRGIVPIAARAAMCGNRAA